MKISNTVIISSLFVGIGLIIAICVAAIFVQQHHAQKYAAAKTDSEMSYEEFLNEFPHHGDEIEGDQLAEEENSTSETTELDNETNESIDPDMVPEDENHTDYPPLPEI